MTHPALDPRTTAALNQIVTATARGARVARTVDHEPGILWGTARNLTDEPDIRDAKLRVTLINGSDIHWPLSELVAEVQAGTVVFDWTIQSHTPTERPATGAEPDDTEQIANLTRESFGRQLMTGLTRSGPAFRPQHKPDTSRLGDEK